MAGWMASAASYLQRCHQAAQEGSVSAAYMEGLDPSHQLNSIAQARQALQVQQQYNSSTTGITAGIKAVCQQYSTADGYQQMAHHAAWGL